MTAKEMFNGLNYVVIKDDTYTIAVFEDEYDAEMYAEKKSLEDEYASYHVEEVVRTK